jgi:excisionase family DNA binding protein
MQVLSSWKEIARYLGKGVRTVQRWEACERLPVHRPGQGLVLAYAEELDTWVRAEAGRDEGDTGQLQLEITRLQIEIARLKEESAALAAQLRAAQTELAAFRTNSTQFARSASRALHLEVQKNRRFYEATQKRSAELIEVCSQTAQRLQQRHAGRLRRNQAEAESSNPAA